MTPNNERDGYYEDFAGIEATVEEELYGTPTVPLAIALEKAFKDADEDM